MNKSSICVIMFLISNTFFCQTTTIENFNLGFEEESKYHALPKGWFEEGKDYKIETDSITKYEGKRSAVIYNIGPTDSYSFGTILLKVPANFKGKQIVLKGYMKTQDVTNGFAGLVLRVDGTTDVLQFDNMYRQNISGTADWKPYSIRLPFPSNAKSIAVGAILTGSGKMWVDNLSLLVDDVNISVAERIEQAKAYTDNEFDEGSTISFTNLSKRNIRDLKLVGLIWGYLKYYHPNAGSGQYNMDYELFRILKKILNSNSLISRDDLLEQWIDSFGKFECGNQNFQSDELVKVRPDLQWLHREKMSETLRAKLNEIKNAKRNNKNHYVTLNFAVGNPEFNEESYQHIKPTDQGFKLLALFRYWNIIKYYFPYKYLIEEDWDELLAEFIPKFNSVSSEEDYRLVVLEIVSRIKDTHAGLRGSEGALREFYGKNYLCAKISFVEDKAVVTGFYDDSIGSKSELQIGDIILSINGKSVDKIVRERSTYTPASNDASLKRIIASNMLRTNNAFMKVELKRGKSNHVFEVQSFSTDILKIYKQKKEPCFKEITPNLCYINLGYWKSEFINEFKEKIEKCDGLIIDLRTYPSEFMVFELGETLMPSSRNFVRFTSGSVENPGLFTLNAPLPIGKENKDFYKGKIIILVNEGTQSLGEYCAMAFRKAPGAKVLGSTTAGADGNISKIMLPGRVLTAMSGIGVYYPDGTETQRIGILPDIEVRPTIAGIAEKRDELLEEAVRILKNH